MNSSSGSPTDAAVCDSSALEQLRREINVIDAELVAALNRRAACSLKIGTVKAATGVPITCPERERTLLDRLAAISVGPLPEEDLRAIYAIILLSSRGLQTGTQARSREDGACATQ